MRVQLRDAILTSLLMAFLVAQNYILFSLPITLTYVVIYFIARKVKGVQIPLMGILAFVVIKNIIQPGGNIILPLFDFIGLSLFIIISKTGNSFIRYPLTVLGILSHIFLLDLSTAIFMGGGIMEGLLAQLFTGSMFTYIYSLISLPIILSIEVSDIMVVEEEHKQSLEITKRKDTIYEGKKKVEIERSIEKVGYEVIGSKIKNL